MSPGTPSSLPAGTPGRRGRHRGPGAVASEPPFRRLWLANALDEAGKPVATLGLSVTAIVVLDAGAGQMGVLTALTQVAYLLFALPAGVWVDRARKRRVLVLANVIRGLALAGVFAAHLTGTLALWHLYALAGVLATAGLFVDTAQGALVPLLVGRPRVSEAQSRLQAVDSVVQSAGPGLTGLALARLAPPGLFAFSAVTSLASALAASRIGVEEPRRVRVAGRAAFWPELVTGVRFTFRQPALRTGALASAANNLGAGMVMTIGALFVMRDLGLSPTVYAISGSVGAAGALLASFAGMRLLARFGEVRVWTWCYYLRPAVFLVLPLGTLTPVPAVAVVMAGEVIFAFVFVLTSVTAAGIRAQVTPMALMGRVGSATRFLTFGVLPLGALLGGALGASIGHRETLLVAAASTAVGLLVVAASPLRTMRRVDEEWAREATEYDATVAAAREQVAGAGAGAGGAGGAAGAGSTGGAGGVAGAGTGAGTGVGGAAGTGVGAIPGFASVAGAGAAAPLPEGSTPDPGPGGLPPVDAEPAGVAAGSPVPGGRETAGAEPAAPSRAQHRARRVRVPQDRMPQRRGRHRAD